jgi:hypothetical protein
VANHDAWKNDYSRSDEYVAFNLDARRFLKVRYDSYAYADDTAIVDRNQMRARRFQNGIVANPNALPDVHSSSPMQRDAKAPSTRHNPGQMLQHTVFETSEGAFFH